MESREIARLSHAGITRESDYVTSESPLAIIVTDSKNSTFEMGITMRTKGDDRSLILGFLYSEGVIDSITDVSSITIDEGTASVVLNESSSFESDLHQRNSTVTSSCGLCGRSDLNGLLELKNTILDVFKTDRNISDIDFDTIKSWAKKINQNDPFSAKINELDDEKWLEQVISFAANKPANEWNDTDYNDCLLYTSDAADE